MLRFISQLQCALSSGLTVFLLLVHTISAQQLSIEEGWKGIKIFQTTRAELEKRFGSPVQYENSKRFETADEVVDVIFSGTPCTFPIGGKRFYSFQKDTVLKYGVYMTKLVPISQITWRRDEYERKEDTYHRNTVRYTNSKIGVEIFALINRDRSEEVLGFNFYPPKGQELLFACSAK